MFSGHGPGAQTSDGCSVELYRQLPYLNDFDAVRTFLAPNATILELGCAAGRLTRELLALGLKPTSVDNSPEMLALLPPGARAVLSSIELLDLDEKFDLALLPSCLINHPDGNVRTSFVATAARHLKPGGRFLFQRHDPHWLREAKVGYAVKIGPADVELISVHRAKGFVEMTLRYAIANQAWAHSFTVVPLDELPIENLLSAHGFHSISWHGKARRWAVAER